MTISNFNNLKLSGVTLVDSYITESNVYSILVPATSRTLLFHVILLIFKLLATILGFFKFLEASSSQILTDSSSAAASATAGGTSSIEATYDSTIDTTINANVFQNGQFSKINIDVFSNQYVTISFWFNANASSTFSPDQTLCAVCTADSGGTNLLLLAATASALNLYHYTNASALTGPSYTSGIYLYIATNKVLTLGCSVGSWNFVLLYISYFGQSYTQYNLIVNGAAATNFSYSGTLTIASTTSTSYLQLGSSCNSSITKNFYGKIKNFAVVNGVSGFTSKYSFNFLISDRYY